MPPIFNFHFPTSTAARVDTRAAYARMNTPTTTGTAPAHPASAAAPQVFDRRQRITIATPCYDFSLTEYYLNSLRACTTSPTARFRGKDGTVALDSIIAGRISLPNDSHVDRARNVLANLWYTANETDWLLWIDADIEFAPEHIARLFVHAQHGHKFLGGLYAMKCLKPTFVANTLPGKRPDPATGLLEVLHLGTGFMLIHRDVLTQLQTHPDVRRYKCAPNTPWADKFHYTYFGSGVAGPKDEKDGSQQWLSEDWMICQRWRDLGGQIMADTEIKLRHLGRMLYPPTVGEIIEATTALLRQNNPHIDIAALRAALATYQPTALPKAA